MSYPCGGCEGKGNHRRHCPRNPDYHPWRVLADQAEGIGDQIGGNDPGIANRAYALAGEIREAISEHPWKPLLCPTCRHAWGKHGADTIYGPECVEPMGMGDWCGCTERRAAS